MSENTKIEWCDHTFNPWIGCTKVSTGCANCYAEELMDTRYGKARWGKGQPRVRTSAANWDLPLKWNRGGNVCVECGAKAILSDCDCGQIGAIGMTRRPRVFCASLADWLDDEVPIEWLVDLLKLIHDTPNLDWLVLSKRSKNFFQRCRLDETKGGRIHNNRQDLEAFASWLKGWLDGNPPSNVWIGTSVEDQKRADERIPQLLAIPARVRFLSVEPMLGPIDFARPCFNGADSFGSMEGIHWVIFGGESGRIARPCSIEWIRDGVKQCRAAGVAPFVKQLGAHPWHGTVAHETEFLDLKDKKGGNQAEWPEDLRVREFPEVTR